MSNVLKVSEAASLALHTMVLLAANPGADLSTKKIASTLRVSEAHLSKVLQRLSKVALVRSARGPKGGFMLGRDGKEITLLEVYEAIEGPLAPSDCLLGTRICGGKECILGEVLETTNKQVREYLARTKLTDLTSVYGRKKVNA